MNSFERAHAAAEKARQLLSQYPNVVSIGVGTKRIAGDTTETWCVSISVRAKLPPDQLPAGAVIPAEIDGVPTDVNETGDFDALIFDPKDKMECYELNIYRPLRGGIKISTAWATTTGIEADNGGMGTLGCVVLTKESPPRHVILTNWHVVAEVLPHGQVGQPHPDPGSSCCGSTEIIGNVYDIAKDTFNPPSPSILPVDAALISLSDGLTWVAGLATAGRGTSSPVDPIAAIRDLKGTSPPPPPNLPVKKRGARTGPAAGKVINFSSAKTITLGARTINGVDMSDSARPYYLSLPVMQINADAKPIFSITAATQANPCVLTAPGHTFTNGDIVYVFVVEGMTELNSICYKVGTVSPSGTLSLLDLAGHPINSTTFTAYTGGGKVGLFTPFALPGDSGSLVCDLDNNVVGLLFSGNKGSVKIPPGAIVQVCHIADVLDAMKINLPLTAATPGVQTVPANNNPYKNVTNTNATMVMAKLQNDLLETEHGVAIARAILAHEREVRALIGENKRVAARWRHVSERQLVEGFVAAVFEQDLPVVVQNPTGAKRDLERFADVLAKYASARLREDLSTLRHLFAAMLDLTYRDILATLGTHPGSQEVDSTLTPAEQTRRSAAAVIQAIQVLLSNRTTLSTDQP